MSAGITKTRSGENFPGPSTLNRLQREYDISMDWLLFNKGPMTYKVKQQQQQNQAPTPGEHEPDILKMVEDMESDSQLKYEIVGLLF